MSLPFGPRPSINSDIAFELGAVARMTCAPPSFCNSSAALVDWLSMYTLAPSFLCERCVFGAAPNSRDLITKLVRELNSEMTQTANTLHRDQIARERTTVPQRVVRGDSSAEQRSCVNVT